MKKGRGESEGEVARSIVTENRKARFHYQILDVLEAGIVLSGAEIKSIRSHGMSIEQSYVRPQGGEVFLLGAHVQPYGFSNDLTYQPERARKLLLHRREIDSLIGAIERRGLTIIPLKVYILRGRVKVEIAVAKGKTAPDKRDAIQEREDKRSMQRVMKNRNRD